jgi:hypothetical protein
MSPAIPQTSLFTKKPHDGESRYMVSYCDAACSRHRRRGSTYATADACAAKLKKEIKAGGWDGLERSNPVCCPQYPQRRSIITSTIFGVRNDTGTMCCKRLAPCSLSEGSEGTLLVTFAVSTMCKGWVQYYGSDKYAKDCIGIGYTRWAWSVLEPKEGHYNWSEIDGFISQFKRHGKKTAFGVMSVSTGLGQYVTPKWVFGFLGL